MPLDAPTLRKKLSRTCDEGARALLSSLLLYVSECADGPPRPEDRAHSAGRTPPSQEASRRPTRFQLLQAKFMGTGREPYLKRTREVGRLISKDKQGPGRSLVSATINRLMEKTKEGASSPGHRPPPPSEKPRWGPPGGKSIVKNIVKKLLAVDEKEKDTGDKSSAQQPGSTRGLLPRIVGRSSILSKLKEKFEQSSCLHSEASVLPLHRGGRKSRSQQRKKVHRPQVRVLHTATMAPSFTRTPPLRFLACTAEPLPALSIATIVCGPQSWQSHCAKISHLDSRRHPQRETSMSSTLGDRTAPLNGEPIGQLESATISGPQADTHSFGLMAPSSECGPPPGSCCISLQGKALPGPVPVLSSASPGDAAAAAAGNKTQGLASHGQDAGEAPEITMTMCSSEDEADRAPADAESQPLFAMQWHLPEQEATAWIPPLDPGADQAAQQAQPAIEPTQTTTQLPTVHKMPAPLLLPPRASGQEFKGSYVSGGENVIERIPAALAPGAENKEGHQYQGTSTPEILGAAKEQGPQGDPRGAAHANRDIPQTGLEPAPSESPCGKGTPLGLRNCHSVSGQSAESSWTTHPSTETSETPASLSKASPAHPTPPRSHSRPGAVQLGLSSLMLAPTQGCTRPEESTTTNKSILCGQEEGRRPVVESILPPRIDEKNISGDLDKDRQSSSDEIPSAGTNASGEAMATGNVTRPTVLQPGGTQGPGHKERPQPGSAQDLGHKERPQPGSAQGPGHKERPQLGSAQDLGHKERPQPGSVQDLGHKERPQPGSAQDLGHKERPQLGSAQGTGHKERPQLVSAQDLGHKERPQPGSSQDPGHRESSQLVSAQGPGHRERPQPGSAQDPGHKERPQEVSAQGPGHKERPQLGVQDPKDKTAEEMAALDEQDRAAQRHLFAAEGNCLVEEGFPQNLCISPGAAEGQFSGDTARPLPLAREALTARPGDTAHTSRVPANPQLCAQTQPAASKCSAGADGRNSAMAANALRDNMVSRSPQERSEGLLSSNRGQPPSVGPPTPSPRGLGLEPHPGLGAPSPSVYAPVPVLGAKPLDPGQQALPRAAPKAKSLGPGAQVDQGVPDGSQLRLEEAGAGHQAGQPEGSEKWGAAPLDQRAVLCMTERQAQAAQDLAGGEKTAMVAKPCPHRAQGQEQALGPCGRRASSPAPGGSPQAGVIPATSRKLKSPGSLAVQGQGQGQGLASGMAAQAQAQLACTGEGVPTAGVPGEPPRPAPRVRDHDSPDTQGSPGAQSSPRGSQLQGHSRAPACPLEPGDGSAWPRSDARGQPSQAPAVEGLPSTPGAERDWPDGEHHRRPLHYTKYKAQSFSDQRAFDLSFRPTILRATDTFAPPK
ncbi:collagen alpha-1(I) chain-like [Dipodomys merriami]|uniref:collagen alpha-1(I) chain-like n=1 Tax=Dipodomys merriami TaxID=94247 RepID=UPI003855BDA9